MKTVIITGAGGGLGTTVVKEFLSKGYQVIATVSGEDKKKELEPHSLLDVQVVDLSNEQQTTAFIQSNIEKYTSIDAALLLAGGFAMGSIADTKSDDIQKQVALNFNTAYHVARPLFSHMLQHGNGRIVFIGSRPAINTALGKSMLAYTLSKSLLLRLAEIMNEEAKGKNVAAVVVAPSTIDTPANRKAMPNAGFDNWVTPAALAGILEFVVGDNGQTLREPVLKVYNNA